MVAGKAPALQSATHFDNDTSSSTDGEVELAFDENISSVSKLNVTTEDGSTNLTSSYTIDDGRVLATLNGVYTDDLEVTYRVTDEAGNAHSSDQTEDVTFAAVTVKANDDVNAYKGSTVAIVANNTSADVEIVGTDDDNDFFRSGSTGSNSKVYVYDTENREIGDYEVTFDGGQTANVTVRELGFSVDIDDLSVTTDDKIEGTVSANAGDRPVTIELLDSNEDTVGTIGADLTGQAEYDFTFDTSDSGLDLDAGNYTVLATDNNSAVETESSTIVVEKAGEGSADFAEGIVTEQRGDVANITVTLENSDYATLTLGSEDVGFQSNVTVEDANGDGQVSLLVDTYGVKSASTETDISGSSSSPYAVPNLDGDDDEITYANITTGVNSLLDAGEYDIEVRSGESTSADSQNVATLVLEERNTTSITSWTAPGGISSDLGETSDVYDAIGTNNVTQSNSVAYGDLAVLQLQASGLEGLLGAQDSDNVNTAFFNHNGTSNEYRLTVEQANPGANRDAYQLVLNDTNTDVFADSENDTYFLVYDTDSSDLAPTERSIENDDEFSANFTVYADEGELTADDEQQTVEDEYEHVEGEHSLDDPYNVSAASEQVVSGETNVAPGTELSLRIRSSGDTQPSFLKTANVYVTENQTFSAMFDFSEQEVDDTYEVRVKGGSAADLTVDGNVVEASATETVTSTSTEDVTDTATEAPTDTATEEPSDTATEEPATEEPTETNTGTPGFGAVVALVALLASALLAVRRD